MFTEDLSQFFATGDFAETVTRSGGSTFPAIFDAAYVDPLRIFTPTDSVDGDTIVNPAGAATDNRLAAIHDVLGGADTTDKRGNYIRGFAQGIRHNPGGIESHNAFEDVTTPVTNRQTSATITPNAADIVGAQAVNSQYRPLPGSALLRAGSHVGYRRDLEGRQRQNPPSIGAYDGALFSAYRAP